MLAWLTGSNSALASLEKVKYAHCKRVDGTMWWSDKMLYPAEPRGWKASSTRHLTLIDESGGCSARRAPPTVASSGRAPLLLVVLLIFVLNADCFTWKQPEFDDSSFGGHLSDGARAPGGAAGAAMGAAGSGGSGTGSGGRAEAGQGPGGSF